VTPEERKEYNHNRHMAWRARKKGAIEIEFVQRKRVADRDGWICQLCRKPIPENAQDKRLRASLDHIIPLAKGGQHTYKNSQITHVICNGKKADK
jgi:5-methylcytosine-specific restriction endonuclease McrA